MHENTPEISALTMSTLQPTLDRLMSEERDG